MPEHLPEELAATPEYDGPEVHLSIGEERFVLTWENTILCTFFTGEGQYDHISHTLPDGRHLAFTLREPAINDASAFLKENNYPQFLSPEVDKATMEWFIALETSVLEKPDETWNL